MAQVVRQWRPGIIAAMAVAAIFALTACGGDGDGDGDGDLPITPVSIEISEGQIVVDLVSVPQGQVIYNMENIGTEEHELVLIRTSAFPKIPHDVAPDALPLAREGGIDEDRVEVIGRIQTAFEPGPATAAFPIPFGNFIIACNLLDVSEEGEIVSHYENGERIAFTAGLPEPTEVATPEATEVATPEATE